MVIKCEVAGILSDTKNPSNYYEQEIVSQLFTQHSTSSITTANYPRI